MICISAGFGTERRNGSVNVAVKRLSSFESGTPFELAPPGLTATSNFIAPASSGGAQFSRSERKKCRGGER
jgi:hypothetical protein